MPTVTSITVDLKAETARFEKSMGQARRTLADLQRDVHSVTQVLGSLGRAGATLGAVRAGLTGVHALMAGMKGDWKQVDEAMGQLPFGAGRLYTEIRTVADLIMGVTAEIKRLKEETKVSAAWTSGIQALADVARSFEVKEGLIGAPKIVGDLAKIAEEAGKAQAEITKMASAAGLPDYHSAIRGAMKSVEDWRQTAFYGAVANQPQVEDKKIAAFREELVRLGDEYGRVTRSAEELAVIQYQALGFGEQEILILTNLSRVTKEGFEARERLRQEVADLDLSTTREAGEWFRGIEADVDAAYDVVREGQALQKSLETPMETMRRDIAGFAGMLEAGAIDAETFGRAVTRSVANAAAASGGMTVGAAVEVTRRFTMAALPAAGGVNTAAEIARNQLAELAKIYEVLRRILDAGGLQ